MASILQRVRYLVLEALYEAECSEHYPSDVLERLLANASEESPELARRSRLNWGRRMVEGVWEQRGALDALIAEAAPRYPVATLAVIDRNILRLAIWELRAEPSAPTAAVINEAVELAHRYGGERTPAFVHGVLGTISRQLRPEQGAAAPPP